MIGSQWHWTCLILATFLNFYETSEFDNKKNLLTIPNRPSIWTQTLVPVAEKFIKSKYYCFKYGEWTRTRTCTFARRMEKVCGRQTQLSLLSSSPLNQGILLDVAQDHLERQLDYKQYSALIHATTSITAGLKIPGLTILK